MENVKMNEDIMEELGDNVREEVDKDKGVKIGRKTNPEDGRESVGKTLGKENGLYCDKENLNKNVDLISCKSKERTTQEHAYVLMKAMTSNNMAKSTTAYKDGMTPGDDDEKIMNVVENENVSNSKGESIVEHKEATANNVRGHDESIDASKNRRIDKAEDSSDTDTYDDIYKALDACCGPGTGAFLHEEEAKVLERIARMTVDCKKGKEENEVEARIEINTEKVRDKKKNLDMCDDSKLNGQHINKKNKRRRRRRRKIQNSDSSEGSDNETVMPDESDKTNLKSKDVKELLSLEHSDKLKKLPFLRKMCKRKLTHLTKNYLEELVLQKVAEVISYQSEIGDCRQRIEILEQAFRINNWRANVISVQNSDLTEKVKECLEKLDASQFEAPLKVVRSVGLQVGYMEDDMYETEEPLRQWTLKRGNLSRRKNHNAKKAQLDTEAASSSVFKIPSKPSTSFPKVQTLKNVVDPTNFSQLSSSSNPLTPHSVKSSIPVSDSKLPKLPAPAIVESPQAVNTGTLALNNSSHQADPRIADATLDKPKSAPAPIHSSGTRVEVSKDNVLATNASSTGVMTLKGGTQTILSSALGHIPNNSSGLVTNTKDTSGGALQNVTILPCGTQPGSPILAKQKALVQTMPAVVGSTSAQKGVTTTESWPSVPSRHLIELTLEDDKSKSNKTSNTKLASSVKMTKETLLNQGPIQIPQQNQVLKNKTGTVIRPQMATSVPALANVPRPASGLTSKTSPQGKRAFSARPNEMSTLVIKDGTTYPVSQVGVSVAHPAPLPETPLNTTNPNNKLAPPAPVLKVTKLAESEQEGGILMSWDMDLTSEHEEVASYQLFSYLEDSTVLPNSDLWEKLGDVNALELPMACTLTQFVGGTRYHFAIRAMDMSGHLGPFSKPHFIEIT